MSTIQETVDAAGYELGYIEYGASLDATDAAEAMSVLNEMMAQWKEQDRDFNWFPQDTLGDTLPVPDWAESGVISNLAINLSARFNIAPSQMLYVKADEGRKAITSRLINLWLTGRDMTHLPLGAGRYSRYDIDTDNI